jgi:predicted transcriptional regulator of viral defense system
MPVIKYKKTLEHIFRKPVFTTEDLHNESIPKNYSKKLLHTLAKSGRIKHIERGKYTNLDDPVAVAAYITPCYLSLWTAMSIRNLTTQIPFGIEVVTSRKRFKRKINFEGTTIVFHTASPRMMFGYENIVWKENIRVPIANREKIVIDAIWLQNIPEEEILQIIKDSDISLLKRYAELTGNEKIVDKLKRLITCLPKKK